MGILEVISSPEVIEFISTFGLAVLLVLYFIFVRDPHRERVWAKRYDHLISEYQKNYAELVKNYTELTRNLQTVRVSSPIKDDPTALAVELYPVSPPIKLRELEEFISALRKLHNIGLFVSGAVSLSDLQEAVDDVVKNESGIPKSLRLTLTWVDHGSVWLTLKSGSKAAMQYVAKVFETGATAKLAQELAESEIAKTDAEVRGATREETIAQMKAEQERLKAENIAATHNTWRNEVRERLKFTDELIAQVENQQTAQKLKALKEDSILRMVGQNLVPVARNLPREYEPPDGLFLLPPGFQDVDET